ncbi:GNAT family N-acetyltransferase [Acidovorax citrulli]|nr:GNAT family N-acetyltransferase [Paracidovorax citrulli]
MIETLTGIIPGSPGAEALYRFRHRVFVEHAGWELPCYGPLEFDEFDTPQAVYLVRRHAESRIAGMLRLLPTTQPYMIQSLWPELMGSHPIPSSPRVWEATRMGVDPDMDPLSRGQTVAELVAGCLEYGTQHGIDQMLAVMSEAHARKIVTGMGWSYERCGPCA